MTPSVMARRRRRRWRPWRDVRIGIIRTALLRGLRRAGWGRAMRGRARCPFYRSLKTGAASLSASMNTARERRARSLHASLNDLVLRAARMELSDSYPAGGAPFYRLLFELCSA